MASSSKWSCFQCNGSISDGFRNGWRLRSGEFAQLCHLCASVFEDGQFCETFHSSDEGWRDCESCGKLVHCGCVVSHNEYLLLDSGGITCMECSKQNFLLARRASLSLKSLIATDNSTEDIARRIQIEPHYWSNVTDFDMQRISQNPESALTRLFEKFLTSTDANPKLGRIAIPKKCAEAFFPEISDPRGFPMKFLDTEGKEWEFYFRYWPDCRSRMYLLEGLGDYMISMKCQAGDIVTFYRMEPEGKMVMIIRKTSLWKLPYQV